MNMHVKILNKISTNQIQKYIKRITYHAQMGFTPKMQSLLNIKKLINLIYLSNKLKEKKYMSFSIDAGKSISKKSNNHS